MSEPRYLERFLENALYRAQALKFMQAVIADRTVRLKPDTYGPADPLDELIVQAKAAQRLPGAVRDYLENPENRAFAKMFIVFLVSARYSAFQPNNLDGWEVFQDLIDEAARERLIFNPASAVDLEPGEVTQYLLDEIEGVQFLEEKLQAQAA